MTSESDKSILREIAKLHKKIDYLTDEVMSRLDQLPKEEEEAQKDFPFAPNPQGIKEIKIKRKE
jgi:hypothetical protein